MSNLEQNDNHETKRIERKQGKNVRSIPFSIGDHDESTPNALSFAEGRAIDDSVLLGDTIKDVGDPLCARKGKRRDVWRVYSCIERWGFVDHVGALLRILIR